MSKNIQDSVDAKINNLREKPLVIAVDNAGPKWFNMPTTEMTANVKRDLHILKMRNVLDPKRHYRSLITGNKKFRPKYFQIGTIIAGADEGVKGNLGRKQRGNSLLDEVLKDTERKKKLKAKFCEIQDKRKYRK